MFLTVVVLCSVSFLTPTVSATTVSETVGINVPTHTKQEASKYTKTPDYDQATHSVN